ncbi:MAG: hypothetical protein JRN59_08580 [Nitrososphaerota archaeon]|nr:hypothetical protein [Nitrososphaerota archaeon]
MTAIIIIVIIVVGGAAALYLTTPHAQSTTTSTTTPLMATTATTQSTIPSGKVPSSITYETVSTIQFLDPQVSYDIYGASVEQNVYENLFGSTEATPPPFRGSLRITPSATTATP